MSEEKFTVTLQVKDIRASSSAEAAGFFEEMMISYFDGAVYPEVSVVDKEGNTTMHEIGCNTQENRDARTNKE